MIIKIINDTIEYNNLVSILLVFETYPHIINDDTSNLFIIEKIKVIKITMNEIIKLHVKLMFYIIETILKSWKYMIFQSVFQYWFEKHIKRSE